MAKRLECIDDEMAAWMGRQHVFFVASAPLSPDGHVNCSPKGGDAFRVLGPLEAVYQDYTGSGAETAAHLRENGRLLVMFCAFDGPPRIARLHGRGELIPPGHPEYARFLALFPPNPGTRAFVRISVERVSTSCGFSVPLMDYRADRPALDKWAEKQGPDGLAEYREAKNRVSLDGLPALPKD